MDTVQNYESGKTQSEVCSVFKVGLRTFGRWVQMRRDSGDFSLQDRPKERKKRKLENKELTEYVNVNRQYMRQNQVSVLNGFLKGISKRALIASPMTGFSAMFPWIKKS